MGVMGQVGGVRGRGAGVRDRGAGMRGRGDGVRSRGAGVRAQRQRGFPGRQAAGARTLAERVGEGLEVLQRQPRVG